jgi:phosphoribosylformimino-5-aminoimidazole carboxamide ribotide isomerase
VHVSAEVDASPSASPLRLYPAVDILGGKAVRLVKGNYDAKTVYDEDPHAAGKRWIQQGAHYLHVVDLDGAKQGEPANLEHLKKIARLGAPVQYGGGLRSLESIKEALSAGAARVILGTAALKDRGFLGAALDRHGPETVLVSVDVRGGQVVVDGWTEAADRRLDSVFAELIGQGVRQFVYTNVDRDGMLDGPDVEDLTWVAGAAGVPIGANQGRSRNRSQAGPPSHLIYSGGIGSLEHLERLAALPTERRLSNLEGVIVGKALYERRFTVAQAHAALAGEPSSSSRGS